MSEQFIFCTACQRRWPVSVQECTYLELEVMSRPCPHCEGYTLSVRTEKAARRPRLNRRPLSGVTTPVVTQS